MKIEFQGKTYYFRDTDFTNQFAELREMVASDMYLPMQQDRPIPYRKVKNYDVELFMEKYFIREVKRGGIVELCFDELKRRAENFLPLKAFDKDAYEFSLVSLCEAFCKFRLSFFIAPTYFDTYNEWLDKFTFIRLEDRKADEPIYFLCDFSKATFDVGMYLNSSSDELTSDITLDIDREENIGKELEQMFYKEFGLD